MRCIRDGRLAIALCLLGLAGGSATAKGSQPQPGNAKAPDVQSLWNEFKKTLPPFTFQVLRDEVVRSDTDPRLQLRRLEIKFYSQEINGEKWGHPSVLFMPADSAFPARPERRGKVVVVGQRSVDNLAAGSWRGSFLGNYGEPIAARTGYPTMVVPVPGEYDKAPGKEISIAFLNDLVAQTGDPADHNYFRLAIPYLRALDVLEKVLDVPKVRAVIGGHSKRATSAFTAAAIDPERIAAVVYMGNESVFRPLEQGPLSILSPFNSQRLLCAEVLYLGATNEDGYEMFNINRIQARMDRPWVIEYIPNYRHADQSEKHFLDWQMWVSHIFDGRALTAISDLSYEETEEGTLFRARVESANKVIQTKVWYAYSNDPHWRDIVWYAEFMDLKANGIREGLVTGRLPDAWLVEVKDTGYGYAGYVSTLPQDISHKPTRERVSRGSRPKDWEPKKPPPE